MVKIIHHTLIALCLFAMNYLQAQTNSAPVKMTAEEFKKSIDTSINKNIIDVRTSKEFKAGYIPTAKNINLYDSDFTKNIGLLDRDQPVYLYCKGGLRSAEAAQKLMAMGFTSVYDLQGGIMAWENKEYALESNTSKKNDNYSIAGFEALITDNSKVLIDFYADWCLPCKKMEPGLFKLELQYQNKIKIVRINVDNAQALTKKLKIEGLPVLVTYVKGKEIKRVQGYQTDEQMQQLVIDL